MSAIKTLIIYSRTPDPRYSDYRTLRYERVGEATVIRSLSYAGGGLSYGGGIIVRTSDGAYREVRLSAMEDGTRVGVISEGLGSLTAISQTIGLSLADLAISTKRRNGVSFRRLPLPMTTDKVVMPIGMSLAVGV